MAAKLDRVRSNTRGSSKSKSSSSGNSSGGTSAADVAVGAFGALCEVDCELAMQMFLGPIFIPIVLLESHGARSFVYEGRPYAHHGKGIVRIEPYIEPPDLLRKNSGEPYVTDAMKAAATVDGLAPQENNWMPGELVEQPPPPPVIEDAPPYGYGEVYTSDDTSLVDRYTYAPPVMADPDWDKGGHLWAAQLAADVSILDANVYRLRPRFRLFTPTRFEFDAEAGIYREDLNAEDRASTGREHDWTTISAAHVAYRFAQSQAVSFRIGAGARLLVDRTDTRVGYDFVYGVEAFPVRPLVLSASAGMGTLGDAFVLDLRASLGVVVGAIEILIGIERLSVGDAVLAGPTGGIRVWF